MTPKQLKAIQDTIGKSIDKTVNGKISILTEEFREHKIIVNQYIKEDNEWKTKAEPVIQMGENVAGFGKVSLYIVGFVASVAGAILVLLKLFRKE